MSKWSDAADALLASKERKRIAQEEAEERARSEKREKRMNAVQELKTFLSSKEGVDARRLLLVSGKEILIANNTTLKGQGKLRQKDFESLVDAWTEWEPKHAPEELVPYLRIELDKIADEILSQTKE